MHITIPVKKTRMPPTNTPSTLNHRLQQLVQLASQPTRHILGLMSGTSLDGLELALCQFSGHGHHTRWKLLHHLSLPYSPEQRSNIRKTAFRTQTNLAELTTLNSWLGIQFAEMILKALKTWLINPHQVHCIASHGQTIYHAPHSWQHQQQTRHASLQLADGDHIAVHTGIITLSDFRQKAIAQGSQGAPLAPFAEALLFSAAQPRVFINLGGIANYTWLPPKHQPQPPKYADSGPANMLLDAAFRHFWPQHNPPWDEAGQFAQQGTCSQKWLHTLLQHPYFKKSPPKSTGAETFGEDFLTQQLPLAPQLSPPDILATLCQLTAHTITQALQKENLPVQPTQLFITGGGIHNQNLLQALHRQLQEKLPHLQLQNPQQLKVPPQAKEALLFATFANETLCGSSNHSTALGKISFPD